MATFDPAAIPYDLDPEFERAVVFYEVTMLLFHERIGKDLSPQLLGSDEARLLVAVAQQLAAEGQHSGNKVLVRQRLRNQADEQGRLRAERIAACTAYLDDIDADELPPVEGVIAALVPFVRRQLHMQAHKVGLNALTDEAAAQQAVVLYQRAADTGKESRGIAQTTGADMLDGAVALLSQPKLQTQILELDQISSGGFSRGELGYVVGLDNEGKSMMLVHFFCAGLRQGLHFLYATLELASALVDIRIAAHLTGIPINAIRDARPNEFHPAGGDAWNEAKRRLTWLAENRKIGRGRTRDFPAETTNLGHIWAWVEEEEKLAGRRVDGVLIDADEHVSYSNDEWSDYKGMGKLYAGMRAFAMGPDPKRQPEKTRWVITASQAKNKDYREDYIKTHRDAADSSRKGRIADWCVTVNVRDNMNILNLSRNRNDDKRATSPLQADFACARPVAWPVDPYPWVVQARQWNSLWHQENMFNE